MEAANQDDLLGSRRYFTISKNYTDILQISNGDLLELRNQFTVPLRGWARVGRGEAKGITLGPDAMNILQVSPGDELEIRLVQSFPEGVK